MNLIQSYPINPSIADLGSFPKYIYTLYYVLSWGIIQSTWDIGVIGIPEKNWNICRIHSNGHVINNEEMQEPCKTVAHIILTASLFWILFEGKNAVVKQKRFS